MPNCSKIKENLTAYLDNELDSYIRGIVEEHLAKCAVCRKELEALSNTWKLLDRYPRLSISSSYKENFYRKLRETNKPVQLKRWLYPVAAAAAVIIAITLTITISDKQPGNGTDVRHAPVEITQAEIALNENIPPEDAEVVAEMDVLEELGAFGENDLADLIEFLDSQQEPEILQDLMELTDEPF